MTIQYLIQVLTFQLVFLLIYDLLLKRETFFNANRSYLLLIPLLSIVLPFVKIGFLRESVPEEMIVQLPAVVIGSSEIAVTDDGYSLYAILNGIWITGVVFSIGLLLVKLTRFVIVNRNSVAVGDAGINLRMIPKSNAAFSFWNTIYLGDQLTAEQRHHILEHELVHVRQRHSLDLILFELLKVIFWFNPLVYVYQQRISVLHEFIADRDVARKSSKKNYYQQLLAQAFQTNSISFINSFFKHSLIKKRINMLNRSNSKKSASLRYLLLLPILIAMLIYTSCAQETPVAAGEDSQSNDFTQSSDSDIMNQIATLKESIAAKGDMTEEEQKALKSLYVITSEEGVNNFYFEDIHEETALPFGAIQKAPVYPGCEGQEGPAAHKCFTVKVTEFVVQNFNTKAFKDSGISGQQRIFVQFTIDDSGSIKDIKSKSEHQALANEAERVVSLLPKMTAGTHDGKKVNVSFALPILFEM